MRVSLLLALLLVVPAAAQNPIPHAGDRVFPEPMESTAFIQWADFEAGLKTLAERHAQFVEVLEIGRSLGDLPIYLVEVTNEAVPREGKLQLGYSASIHANEAAGREGMLRAIEDLASGTGPLGDLQPLLDQLILVVWFPNPDSWASGDLFTVDPAKIAALHVPGYRRGNAAGIDLNREFPNPGLILPDHTPMSEPESQAIVRELRYSGRHTNLVAGTDLHGMIDSPNMMRAIIPNQDYDFHRMMVTVRYLKDLEQRVNSDPHFAEWDAVAQLLCLVPAPPGVPTGQTGCVGTVPGPLGEVGHGKPFLWGARWDQIGYTDSGFTSDYMMLSPRSPTGGMGAMGTITEFAYSHVVPDNKYVAKLTDMHVAGVRATVRAQMEYALLKEEPRLAATGTVLFVEDPQRATSRGLANAYRSSNGAFDLADNATWFDFDQVPYDVAATDFWHDLARFSSDDVVPVAPADLASRLPQARSLVLTDRTVDLVDAAAVRAWVESGGNLLLTDQALTWFDKAGLTANAAKMTHVYLGHSDLTDRAHPLLAGVDWNARQTGEGVPVGYTFSPAKYPQWTLDAGAAAKLDLHVAGTTKGNPSLGTATVGNGKVHFLGAALPPPSQDNDHRYGLAPYAVTALSYHVFVNALGGTVEWQARDGPFVPEYPSDPLYGVKQGEPTAQPTGTPGFALVLALVALALGLAWRRR
jgi:hypothetical protein